MRPDEARLLAFHKPKGLVVTASDELGRRTVYDALPAWVREGGWRPVGRLDRDSRGLLLFTREGALVEALTRPGACDKTYEVWVRGRIQAAHLAAAREGVGTAAGSLRCKSVRVTGFAPGRTRLEVVLDEGKNRHIRRLFGALADAERGTPLKVLELKRVAVGPLALDVASGAWRCLEPGEVRALCGGADGGRTGRGAGRQG